MDSSVLDKPIQLEFGELRKISGNFGKLRGTPVSSNLPSYFSANGEDTHQYLDFLKGCKAFAGVGVSNVSTLSRVLWHAQ